LYILYKKKGKTKERYKIIREERREREGKEKRKEEHSNV